MAEEMVSINDFAEFDQPGAMLEGTFAGVIRSAAGEDVAAVIPQFVMVTKKGGIVRFNSTMQLSVLDALPIGSALRVTFKGDVPTRSGYRVKRFDIQVSPSAVAGFIEGIKRLSIAGPVRSMPNTPSGDPALFDNDPFR